MDQSQDVNADLNDDILLPTAIDCADDEEGMAFNSSSGLLIVREDNVPDVTRSVMKANGQIDIIEKLDGKNCLPMEDLQKETFDKIDQSQDFVADLNNDILLHAAIDCVGDDVASNGSPVLLMTIEKKHPDVTASKDTSVDLDDKEPTEARALSPDPYSFGNVKDIEQGYIINDKIAIPKLSWHTITGNKYRGYYCLVCNCHMIDFLVHMNSGRHLFNLDKCPPMPTFGLSLIRMINGTCHCAVCNNTFPSEHNQHLLCKSHLIRYNQAYNKAQKCVKDPHKDEQVAYAEIAKKTKWEDPPDFIFGIQDKYFKIPVNNWHMMVWYSQAFYCISCGRDGDITHKYDHMFSKEHMFTLVQNRHLIPNYKENLVRTINFKYSHCMHCNTVFHITEDDHIYSKLHKNQMLINMLDTRTIPPKRNPEQTIIQIYMDRVFMQPPYPLPLLHCQNNGQNYNFNPLLRPTLIQQDIQPNANIAAPNRPPNIVHVVPMSPPIPNMLHHTTTPFRPPAPVLRQDTGQTVNINNQNQPFNIMNVVNNVSYRPATPDVVFQNRPLDITRAGYGPPMAPPDIRPNFIIHNQPFAVPNIQNNPEIFQQSTNQILPNNTTNKINNYSINTNNLTELFPNKGKLTPNSENKLLSEHEHVSEGTSQDTDLSIPKSDINKSNITETVPSTESPQQCASDVVDKENVSPIEYYTPGELKTKFPMLNLDLYAKFNKTCLYKFVNLSDEEVTSFKQDTNNNCVVNNKAPVWPEIMEWDSQQGVPFLPLIKLTPKGKKTPVIVYCPYCDTYEENFTNTSKWKTKRNQEELLLTHASALAIKFINKSWIHCRVCDVLVKVTEIKKHFDPKNPFFDGAEFEEVAALQPDGLEHGHRVASLDNDKKYCLVCKVDFKEDIMVKVKINDISVVTSIVAWNSVVDTNMVRYCFVCEKQIENIPSHVVGDEHNVNLRSAKVIEQYGANMIRKVKDVYHCGLCNLLIMVSSVLDHLYWEQHIKAFTEKVIQSVTTTEPMPSVEVELDPEPDCSERNTINDKKISFRMLHSEKFPDDPFRENFYKAISIGNKIMKVKWQHWNGVFKLNGAYKCIICQCPFQVMDMHINTKNHLENLETVEIIHEFGTHLLRKVSNNKHVHCITCNCQLNVSQNLLEHVNNARHEKHFKTLKEDTTKYVLLDERVYVF